MATADAPDSSSGVAWHLPPPRVFTGPSTINNVRSTAFLRDGKRALSASWDGTVRIWDIEKGLEEPLVMYDQRMLSVVVSPDGTCIASGGSASIFVSDAESGRLICEPLEGHSDGVNRLCFSPDGKRLASGSDDRTVIVWDIATGRILVPPFQTHFSIVRSVSFSPDGQKLLTALDDHTIRIWDANTGRPFEPAPITPIICHRDGVTCALWSRDGSQIVSCSADFGIGFWDSKTGEQIGYFCRGHRAPIWSIDISPDGRCLASASYDGTVRLWGMRTHKQIGPSLNHKDVRLNCATFSPDGLSIISGGQDRRIFLWNVRDVVENLNDNDSEQNNAQISKRSDSLEEEQDYLESSKILQNLTNELQGRSSFAMASGGFGDIWKCYLVNCDEIVEVAVKTIRAFATDGEVEMRRKAKRVRRELKVWGRLEHDCILPLWGVADDFGPYPAMICPWVDNGALTGHLERHQELLSPRDKFSLLNDIALGLQYLHSKAIVHGDLTGSNVLVYRNGRACLADFGLSTMVVEFIGPSYITSNIRGNIRWAAAELFEVPEGDEEDAALTLSTECDIYSFGSIFLQVLTCKVPYHNVKKDNIVLGQVIRGKKPEPPKELVLAPAHWEFIQRCWLPRASRPSVEEIVAFVACERQALSP